MSPLALKYTYLIIIFPEKSLSVLVSRCPVCFKGYKKSIQSCIDLAATDPAGGATNTTAKTSTDIARSVVKTSVAVVTYTATAVLGEATVV